MWFQLPISLERASTVVFRVFGKGPAEKKPSWISVGRLGSRAYARYLLEHISIGLPIFIMVTITGCDEPEATPSKVPSSSRSLVSTGRFSVFASPGSGQRWRRITSPRFGTFSRIKVPLSSRSVRHQAMGVKVPNCQTPTDSGPARQFFVTLSTAPGR